MNAETPSGSNLIFYGVYYLHVCVIMRRQSETISLRKRVREPNHVHEGLRKHKVLQGSRCRWWMSIEIDSQLWKGGISGTVI